MNTNKIPHPKNPANPGLVGYASDVVLERVEQLLKEKAGRIDDIEDLDPEDGGLARVARGLHAAAGFADVILMDPSTEKETIHELSPVQLRMMVESLSETMKAAARQLDAAHMITHWRSHATAEAVDGLPLVTADLVAVVSSTTDALRSIVEALPPAARREALLGIANIERAIGIERPVGVESAPVSSVRSSKKVKAARAA